MDGPHLRFKLGDLKGKSDDGLRELIMVEMFRLVRKSNPNGPWVFPTRDMLQDAELILEKLRVEIAQFNPEIPYPPQGTNLLCVQVRMPPARETWKGAISWVQEVNV